MLSSRVRAGLWPIAAAALTFGLCVGGLSAPAAANAARPNIVLILTDDEDVAAHGFMPKTKALIEDQGTRFANFFVSYSWCCPSRASILRGQYAHNTQVFSNEPPLGGFEKFHARGLERSTLATWLHAAGYRTAMVGKYLNRYVPERDGVPPGWDDWYVGGNAHPSYDYTLNENGRLVHYGNRPEDYLNDVLTGKALQVIHDAAAADEPLFLYVLPYSPHSPSVAAPRHLGMFKDAPLPRTAAFDEPDVESKPMLIRSLPRLDGARIASLTDEYRRRLASLQGVDDMVASIVDALNKAKLLESTYVIYSSDNGFHLGEHRLPAGKDTAYEEDLRVPMVMRGPGVPKGGRIDAMVLNIDYAPTFAEIAGAAPPDFVDGRSFLPLLHDPDAPWRRSFLVERRALEVQLKDLAAGRGMSAKELAASAYLNGLRTAGRTYVEYGTGERELYDLRADRFQRDNVVDEADPALLAALSARLAALEGCAGAACRRLEDLPISPAPDLLARKAPAAKVVPASATK